MDEMNLGTLIEHAVKQIQLDKERESIKDADAASDEDVFEQELFDEDKKAFLKDEDFQELSDMVEENRMTDDEYLQSLFDDQELN